MSAFIFLRILSITLRLLIIYSIQVITQTDMVFIINIMLLFFLLLVSILIHYFVLFLPPPPPPFKIFFYQDRMAPCTPAPLVV